MSTGLNFQTQTIINSNIDIDSTKKNENGSDNTYLFKSLKAKVDGVEKDVFRVKRDFTFTKDNVVSIKKREGYDAQPCKAYIDFSKVEGLIPEKGKTYARLSIYIKIEGAEPFIYATPWVQKGMPFWIEFTVKADSTPEKIASGLAKELKKSGTFLHDKELLDVEADGTKLILTGTGEYQRFAKIGIEVFDETAEYADLVAYLDPTDEDIEDVVLVNRGYNSFGTYSQLVKDLRLPTAEHTNWTHILTAETPIIGAIYDQYIIEQCSPATNDGLQAVGQRLTSYTTHVFWVKHDEDLIKAWEEALGTIGDIVLSAEKPSDEEVASEATSEDDELNA
jgi:hypothetical protein